jgi:hypothetical protein
MTMKSMKCGRCRALAMFVGLLMIATSAASGCSSRRGPGERVGDTVDHATDFAGDTVDRAGDTVRNIGREADSAVRDARD